MAARLDKHGAIITEGSKQLITSPYKEIVHFLENQLWSYLEKPHLEGRIRSFYVRGSVSVGNAIPSYSDLDGVVILEKEPSQGFINYLSNLCSTAIKGSSLTVEDIDMTIVSMEQLLYSPETKNLKIYIKYQSALIFGEEIRGELPSVYPGPLLAMYMYENIRGEVHNLRQEFASDKPVRQYLGKTRSKEFWCVWLVRTLIRSAMALCMFKGKEFTQDLRESLVIVEKFYPELLGMLNTALEWHRNPSSDMSLLIDFIDNDVAKYLLIWDKEINEYRQTN